MTFAFIKKTITIDISLTDKKFHNKRIRDIFVTVVNMEMMTVICCHKIVINDILFSVLKKLIVTVFKNRHERTFHNIYTNV